MLQADPVKLKEDVEASLKLSRELLAEAERTDTDVTGTVTNDRTDRTECLMNTHTIIMFWRTDKNHPTKYPPYFRRTYDQSRTNGPINAHLTIAQV